VDAAANNEYFQHQADCLRRGSHDEGLLAVPAFTLLLEEA
jgi:hypothetical protein